jgi:hypothetical protein
VSGKCAFYFIHRSEEVTLMRSKKKNGKDWTWIDDIMTLVYAGLGSFLAAIALASQHLR